MNSYDRQFTYNGGELRCDGVSLKSLAEQYGTPLYVYSEQGFRERFSELDQALSGLDHLICYSVKSNSNLSLLSLMKEMGSGMDVVSGGELYRALKAGVDPSRIVFAGVGKTEEEIAYAIEAGILMFNCESFPEIELIAQVSSRKGVRTDIAIRVNPDVDAETHHYITTGKKENKFGIAIDHLKSGIAKWKDSPSLRLRGIHCHIGSQITSAGPFIAALERIIEVIRDLRGFGFPDLGYINLGGGYGIRYRDEEFFPVESLTGEIKKRVLPLGLRLIIEPGRYISGNNGVLLVRVVYKKATGSKTFLITDGAMNDLIRPSLYGSFQHIFNLVKREGTEVVDVVGPVCESGDFFAKDREISLTEAGDHLAVMSAGAYGMAMASRYNSRRLPAEVLVTREGKSRLVRRRDTFEDLINNELA